MKSDLDYLSDEELEETYRREVMQFQIEEVRKEKKRRKFARYYYLFAIVCIVLFLLHFCSPEMYNSLNTVGQPIP